MSTEGNLMRQKIGKVDICKIALGIKIPTRKEMDAINSDLEIKMQVLRIICHLKNPS